MGPAPRHPWVGWVEAERVGAPLGPRHRAHSATLKAVGSRRAVGQGSFAFFLVRLTLRPGKSLAHPRAAPQWAGGERTTRPAHQPLPAVSLAWAPVLILPAWTCQWPLPSAWPLPCIVGKDRATSDQGLER